MKTSNKKKMRIGQPFLYNEQMRYIMKSKECDIGDPQVMDRAMKSIEEYIQGTITIIVIVIFLCLLLLLCPLSLPSSS